MSRLLLLFIVLAFSARTIAMEKFDPLKILPNDAFCYLIATFLSPKDVYRASKVNQHWNIIMSSEAIWQAFYCRIWRHTHKDDNTQSWLDNFKKQALIPRPSKLLLQIYNDDECVKKSFRKRFNNFNIYTNLVFRSTKHDWVYDISDDQFNSYFNNMLTDLDGEKTQVIAIYYYINSRPEFLNILKDKLKRALEKDIIVIIRKSIIWEDGINQLYPNVIWVSWYDKNGTYISVDPLNSVIDIFAPCDHPLIPWPGGSSSIMWVAEAASYIRALRPDLTAEDVRRLLIDSAHDREGNKILNLERAKKMALEW